MGFSVWRTITHSFLHFPLILMFSLFSVTLVLFIYFFWNMRSPSGPFYWPEFKPFLIPPFNMFLLSYSFTKHLVKLPPYSFWTGSRDTKSEPNSVAALKDSYSLVERGRYMNEQLICSIIIAIIKYTKSATETQKSKWLNWFWALVVVEGYAEEVAF